MSAEDDDSTAAATAAEQPSRHQCCRLCLAPDNECISIFKSYAADKEPLALKIQSCVNIKITQGDRLSSQICHACISYLNSWQSFKNRCISSQNKQRVWLGLPKSTTITLAKPHPQNHHHHQQQQQQHQHHQSQQQHQQHHQHNVTVAAAHNQNNQYQQNGSPKKSGYPMPIQIKEEPMDEEYGDENDIDPSLFLDNSHNDKKDEVDGSPPSILSSLGLQASGINPLSFLSTVMTDENQEHGEISITAIPSDVNHESCRVCSQKFSTRANARRHERNQHPQLFENTTQIQIQKTVMKPMQQSNPIAVITTTTPFDYSKPDQYMHLLTEDKIQFIKENDAFLRQYQKMTCNCCNRTYTTYKNFMAHMRKKFQNLPRNLCFRCLKQNESKALFISHLKKRNCINLFKIVHGDTSEDRIIKPISLAMQAQHQDLMTNKLYECRHCSKSFKNKLDVRSHMYEEHSEHLKKDNMPGNCGFCGLEIEDPVEIKKHYNNMDCMVSIRCAICMDRFDNQQMFESHVFTKHASNSNNNNVHQQMKQYNRHSSEKRPESITPKPVFFSRLPQSCKICGQSYNNYNNVLRHMESKHPDQLPETYKCTECDAGYPRLSNLKDHMMDIHKMKCEKYRHSMDETSLDSTVLVKPGPFSGQGGTPQQQPYTGRYDYVMKDLMSITNGTVVKMERDDGTDSGTGFSPEAKRMKIDASMKQCNICFAVFQNNIALSNHMRSHTDPDEFGRTEHTPMNTSGGNSSVIDVNTNSNDGNLVIDLKKDEPGETDMDDSQSGLVDTAEARFRRMRCRECQKRFSSKESYRRHMHFEHNVQNVQFIRCKLCNAEFAYEKGLRVHMFKIHNRVLVDDMIIKSFECELCNKVYSSENELVEHRTSSHPLPPIPVVNNVENHQPPAPLYWFQCRYCAANFNTNKKLAIHINSHDEFDSNDYSCKDCGNVYSGRKSLWVHRYKKHPPIAKPSGCASCGKTFFDRVMLEHHLPHCKMGGVPSTKHCTGDEDEVEVVNETERREIPQVKCTMCEEKFSDHEVFAKHIEMHQQDMYSDNPLAAMFGAGESKKNTKSYLQPINEFGEYSCDICHKTFPMLTSLKIHRNWHFRSDNRNDSLNITPVASSSINTTPQPVVVAPPVTVVAPTPPMPQLTPSPHIRRGKTLKCEYCSSTFMSTNNLKRHIAEIHKNEINYQEPPKISPEIYLYCRHCDKTFEDRKTWVEHKIEDAKIMKPFSPFEWGCDICGKYWSRKERLVHHMMAHVRDSTPTGDEEDGGDNNGMDSQDSDHPEDDEEYEEDTGMVQQEEKMDVNDVHNMAEENVHEEEDIIEEVEEEEEEEEEEDEEEEEFDENQPRVVEAEVDLESEDSGSSSEEDSDDDEREQNGHQEDGESSDSTTTGKRLSCDLCQLNFNTQQDLQRHVASHFLNGPGAVTLNERQKTTSTSSSSTSSGGTSSSKDDDNVEELIEEEVQEVSPVIEEDYEDEDDDEEDEEEDEDEEMENA